MHKSKFLCLPFFLSCWKCLNFICGGDFLVQMFRRKLKVKKYKKLWAFVARIIWQIHFKFCYIFTLTTFFFLWKKIGLVFFYYHHYVWLLDLSEDPENPSMKVTIIDQPVLILVMILNRSFSCSGPNKPLVLCRSAVNDVGL